LIDAEASSTSASAASTSAAAALVSENAVAADLVLTNADVALTNADVVLAEADKVQTGLDRTAVAADLVLTNQDTIDTAADLVATNQDTIDTAADVVLTNADVVSTNADVLLTAADVILAEADKVQTGLDRVATAADKVATNADVVLTAADVVSAESAKTAAEAAQTAAELAADNFDDTYLGAKASDPTLDNDGDALTAGDLYFNTGSSELKYYNGSAWTAIVTYTHPTGAGNEHLPSLVSQTEAGYLDGVTSAIQTQLNAKQASGSYEPANSNIQTHVTSAHAPSGAEANAANTAITTADTSWTGSQRGTVVTDNDGSFDMNGGNNFKCTPAGAITLTFTNITSGQSGFVLLVNSGGHTVSAHANSKVDANLLATVSTAGTYLIGYFSDGTNVYLTNSAIYA